MKRKIGQWVGCRPDEMVRSCSDVALSNALLDAKCDIILLHKAVMILLAEHEDADYMTTAERTAFARRALEVKP